MPVDSLEVKDSLSVLCFCPCRDSWPSASSANWLTPWYPSEWSDTKVSLSDIGFEGEFLRVSGCGHWRRRCPWHSPTVFSSLPNKCHQTNCHRSLPRVCYNGVRAAAVLSFHSNPTLSPASYQSVLTNFVRVCLVSTFTIVLTIDTFTLTDASKQCQVNRVKLPI